MNPQFLDTKAAFALRVTQLSERLYADMADAMATRGLRIVTKVMGIVQLLYSEGPRSQADIAQRLRYSHQLTAQRLRWLYQHDYAMAQPDPSDGRRSLIDLTDAGRAEGEKLQRFLPLLIESYQHLFAELSLDMDALVQQADRALAATPLSERMPSDAHGE
ncbi:MAG: winged helix DNA-binding protein [Pseudomonadota bacterium]